jgi:hypothetical protein
MYPVGGIALSVGVNSVSSKEGHTMNVTGIVCGGFDNPKVD